MLIFIKLILSFLFIYSAGNVLYRLLIKETFVGFSRLFIKSFLGLFSLVTFYSIIKTNGITINTGLLLIVILIIIQNKNKNWSINKSGFKEEELQDLKLILYCLPFIIIFFAWRYYCLFSTNAEIPVVYVSDTLNHCIRAMYINQTGIETGNVNYYFLPDGVDPYHYFEAWTVAFFGSLLKLNFWVAAQSVVLPLFNIIIVTGTIGIVEKWTKNYFIYLICIGAVFFGAYYIEQIETLKFLNYSFSFGCNSFDEFWTLKLSVLYIIVLVFLHIIYNKKNLILSVITLLSMPILTIILAPTMLSIITLVILILIIFRKKLKIEIPFYTIFYPFLIGGFIFLFYKIFGQTTEFIDKPSTSILLELKSFTLITHRIFIGFEKIIQMFILYLPYILIFLSLLIFKKIKINSFINDIRLFGLSIILIIGVPITIFIWLIFYSFFGSSQFYFYTMLPFLNLISFMVLIYGLVKITNKLIKYLILILILFSFCFFSYRSFDIYMQKRYWFDKYSVEYINRTIQEISKLENKKGLKLEHPDELYKFNDASSFIASFVFAGVNGSNNTSVTMGEMYSEKIFPTSEAEMFLKKAPFSMYIDKLKNENHFISLIDATISFIHEYKVQFMFVSSKREIPNELMNITRKVIEDTKSGEKLLIFK